MPLPRFILSAAVRSSRWTGVDADARTYLEQVEAQDGQQLEPAVISAVSAFVVGLKTDGLWSKIAGMCVFGGARTVSGAAVPLRGPAINLYPSGSIQATTPWTHSRRNGLRGIAVQAPTTPRRWLDSGVSHAGLGQNDVHVATWMSALPDTISFGTALIGVNTGTVTGSTRIQLRNEANGRNAAVVLTASSEYQSVGQAPVGLIGATRNNPSSFITRVGSADVPFNATSQSPRSGNVQVFSSEDSSSTDATLFYYSIGQHIDLAAMDGRVNTLRNAILAAIPA